ncbi:MAG: hypothetical protein ACXWXO_01650 [Nocardioides sp.]
MSTRPWRRTVRYACAGALAAVLLTSTSAATAPPFELPRQTDLVASAHPTPTDLTVRDEALETVSIMGNRPRADAVATASATCDGCHGAAVAVQVAWVVWGWRLRADNVATAWASCTDCAGDAVSVQLVLLRGPAALTVNNRALAVTTGCAGCTANAAAYQIVVQAPAHPADLDGLRGTLAVWAGRQAARSGAEPAPGARTMRRQAERGLAGLERKVAGLVGGAVLKSSVDVRSD